jgi:hypothetical protein
MPSHCSVVQLSHCEQVFLQATKKISQAKTPLLHQVIPIMDVITPVEIPEKMNMIPEMGNTVSVHNAISKCTKLN